MKDLITRPGLVIGRPELPVVWRGGFQIRVENLGGQQSIYVAQVKLLLGDRELWL